MSHRRLEGSVIGSSDRAVYLRLSASALRELGEEEVVNGGIERAILRPRLL